MILATFFSKKELEDCKLYLMIKNILYKIMYM